MFNFTPRPLYPGKETRYPLYRRLGGLQGRSGRVPKIAPFTGIRSQYSPAASDSLFTPCRSTGEVPENLHAFQTPTLDGGD